MYLDIDFFCLIYNFSVDSYLSSFCPNDNTFIDLLTPSQIIKTFDFFTINFITHVKIFM